MINKHLINKRLIKKTSIILILTILFISCEKSEKTPPIDNSIDLDGTQINDSSLTYPERFLLSAKIPAPSDQDKNTPVYICVHGFTATTFEWIEFRDFVRKKGNAYTSLVLLGGHGRDYNDFKNASWEDWQQPIKDEYTKLINLGYKKIYFIGSSTGCPLLLDIVSQNVFNSSIVKKMFLIDPIISPSNKTLTLVNTIGPALGYSASEMEKGENGFWYKYRPYQALYELNTLTQLVRKKLEKGLTSEIPIETFKSNKDGSADPLSAALIEKGINGTCLTNIIPSNLHVFTRLNGRNNYTTEDYNLQQNTFNQLLNQ